MTAAVHERNAENRAIAMRLVAIVVLMAAFAYALVPLYRKICEVTGIYDSRIVSTNTQVDASRSITVGLVSNTGQGLAWQFEPLDRSVSFHPGELMTVHYRVKNTLDRAVVGRAVPSYSPAYAGKYIQKQQCFCFGELALGAGEERILPVVFTVTSELPSDVEALSMSYTFFESPSVAAKAP